ncbi:hypothetical protein [Pseudomonas sp. NPDC089734]|uniref:hypothetical protein n=1 Tax=Pseudomonas sp. NPDC089734 TaxID=3364469 RepID=UPI00381D12B6
MSRKNKPWSRTGEINTDLSNALERPLLPGINSDAISHEQVHAGISVHIPYSPVMQPDDLIIFYWGRHQTSTPIRQQDTENTIAGILCITYNLITHVQYGLVELYYEIHRADQLIGTSPLLRVTVSHHAPVTSKQRQRKRSMKRRFPAK